MAHVMHQQAIGEGARVWLQTYDEEKFSMVLLFVTVDEIMDEGTLFQTNDGLLCGWQEDYNYRFGWRCWDAEPTEEDLRTEPFNETI